ncbi:MAG TPA: 7TM diverse intracellular signaling domain-containing protein, partial [Rectinemataceae bacterium]|nr:7TM diverse intracellular signaling domain-containing protein [Rectinemataceae bacterium]
MKKILFMLLAIVFFDAHLAASPFIKGGRPAIHLEDISEFYFDADPGLGISDVSAEVNSSRFTPVAGRMIWVGKKAPAAWLRFVVPTSELANGHDGAEGSKSLSQWLLVVRPSFSIILDHVDFFVPRGDGSFDEIRSGAKAAVWPSEPQSRFFAFELPSGAFEGKPCYLRLSSETDVEVNFDIETSVGFGQSEGLSYIVYGIIYGILLAMVLYSFFLLLSLKDVTYLYYILYVVSAGLWLFFLQGHAKLIFGQIPNFDQAMLWLWAGSMITWGAVFTASFLRMKESQLFLFRMLIV